MCFFTIMIETRAFIIFFFQVFLRCWTELISEQKKRGMDSFDPSTCTELFKKVKDQEIILLLGSTGSGKSTIGNLLVGHSVRVSHNGCDIESPDGCFNIGSGARTQTLQTQIAHSLTKQLIVDTPGLSHVSLMSKYTIHFSQRM